MISEFLRLKNAEIRLCDWLISASYVGFRVLRI